MWPWNVIQLARPFPHLKMLVCLRAPLAVVNAVDDALELPLVGHDDLM